MSDVNVKHSHTAVNPHFIVALPAVEKIIRLMESLNNLTDKLEAAHGIKGNA